MTIRAINPATGQVVREHEEHSEDDVAAAIDAAHTAFLAWRDAGFEDRAGPLRRVAELLRTEKNRLARLMAEEMGKPLAQGEAETEKCAWACEFFAKNAARFLEREHVTTNGEPSFVAYRPLGVVFAIMPWNFPLWQVLRFGAPALMAGNAVVLKHAESVPGCALEIEALFRRAGLPDGLFRTLLIDKTRAPAVIAHPRVAAVTLTGSVAAGRAVAEQAGRALKKTVLELGGSDPYLVLEDADLDAAVAACVRGRLVNAGQSCIAAKRFLVVEPVRAAFEERLVEAMAGKRFGDPLDPGVDLGPLARHDLRDNLHRQVVESVQRGAVLRLGGEVPPGPGAFYPPTVLCDVRPGMPAFDEETFGPVAAVIPCANEDDAIRLANATAFGLGAAVFTRDVARGEDIAVRRLDAGAAFVNTEVHSDPRLPFGGIRDSGYGRELGEHGIREFVNIKTVRVAGGGGDDRATRTEPE